MSDMKDTNKQTTPVVKITLPNFEEDKKKERKGLPPWLLGGKDASTSIAGAGLRGGGSAAQQGFWGRLLSMFGKGGRGLGAGEAAAGAGTRGGFFARLFSMFGKGGAGFGGAGLGGGSLAAGGLLGGKFAVIAAMGLVAAGIVGAGLYMAKAGFGRDDDSVGRGSLSTLASNSRYVPEADRAMPNRSSLQMLSDRNSAAGAEANRNRSVKDEEMPFDSDENVTPNGEGGANVASAGGMGTLGGIPKLGDALSGSKYSYAGGSGGGSGSGSSSIGGGFSNNRNGSGSRGVLTGGDSGATALSGSSGLSASNRASRFGRTAGIGVGRQYAASAGRSSNRQLSGTRAQSQAETVDRALGAAKENDVDGVNRDITGNAWGDDSADKVIDTGDVPSGGGGGSDGNSDDTTVPGGTTDPTGTTNTDISSATPYVPQGKEDTDYDPTGGVPYDTSGDYDKLAIIDANDNIIYNGDMKQAALDTKTLLNEGLDALWNSVWYWYDADAKKAALERVAKVVKQLRALSCYIIATLGHTEFGDRVEQYALLMDNGLKGGFFTRVWDCFLAWWDLHTKFKWNAYDADGENPKSLTNVQSELDSTYEALVSTSVTLTGEDNEKLQSVFNNTTCNSGSITSGRKKNCFDEGDVASAADIDVALSLGMITQDDLKASEVQALKNQKEDTTSTYNKDLDALKSTYDSTVESENAAYEAELAALTAKGVYYGPELDKCMKDHQDELKKLEDGYTESKASLSDSYKKSIASLDDSIEKAKDPEAYEKAATIDGLNDRKTAAKTTYTADTASAKTSYESSKSAIETSYSNAVAAENAAYEAKMAEFTAKGIYHGDALNKCMDDHQAALKQLKADEKTSLSQLKTEYSETKESLKKSYDTKVENLDDSIWKATDPVGYENAAKVKSLTSQRTNIVNTYNSDMASAKTKYEADKSAAEKYYDDKIAAENTSYNTAVSSNERFTKLRLLSASARYNLLLADSEYIKLTSAHNKVVKDLKAEKKAKLKELKDAYKALTNKMTDGYLTTINRLDGEIMNAQNAMY